MCTICVNLVNMNIGSVIMYRPLCVVSILAKWQNLFKVGIRETLETCFYNRNQKCQVCVVLIYGLIGLTILVNKPVVIMVHVFP